MAEPSKKQRALENSLRPGDIITLWVEGSRNYNGLSLLRVYPGQVVDRIEDGTVYFRDLKPEVGRALNKIYAEGQAVYEIWKMNGKSS